MDPFINKNSVRVVMLVLFTFHSLITIRKNKFYTAHDLFFMILFFLNAMTVLQNMK